MALKYCRVFEPVSTVEPEACLDPFATIHLRSEVLGEHLGMLKHGEYNTCANHHQPIEYCAELQDSQPV